MKHYRWFSVLLLILTLHLTGCASQPAEPGGPEMTFKAIGARGTVVFITLLSPSLDAVSPQDLANRLKQDWQNQVFSDIDPKHITVFVLDNEEAAQQYLAIYDGDPTLSRQEMAAKIDQIFPHRIAIYERNTNIGVNEVLILSRDMQSKVVQRFKF
jgi:hypothetical protein